MILANTSLPLMIALILEWNQFKLLETKELKHVKGICSLTDCTCGTDMKYVNPQSCSLPGQEYCEGPDIIGYAVKFVFEIAIYQYLEP